MIRLKSLTLLERMSSQQHLLGPILSVTSWLENIPSSFCHSSAETIRWSCPMSIPLLKLLRQYEQSTDMAVCFTTTSFYSFKIDTNEMLTVTCVSRMNLFIVPWFRAIFGQLNGLWLQLLWNIPKHRQLRHACTVCMTRCRHRRVSLSPGNELNWENN